MNGGLRVAYRIDASVESPSDARRIVSGELSRFVPPWRLEDVKLMVSELVTGRVTQFEGEGEREGERDPSGRTGLTLDVEAQEVIRCTITDHGPAALPSGWALHILDSLADRWGLERDRDSTRVWFETERL
jgi:hypothetical protein